MERLTFVDEKGKVLFTPEGCDEDVGYTIIQLAKEGHIDLLNEIACRLANHEQRLKHYEELEEQGLLPKLPCKVGDTVYAYCSEFGILQYTVDCIVFDDKITYQCSSYSEPIGDCPSECLDEIEPDISDFGKIVFLTQAEAEEALKGMEKSK